MTLHYTTATIDGMDLEITFTANGADVNVLSIEYEGPPTLAFVGIEDHDDTIAACRDHLRIKALAAKEWEEMP